jgi:hypothetical protein
MPKPVAAVLYLATTLATVLVGLMSFNFYHAAISPTYSRWLGPLAVSEFAVPTVFILATISVLRANSKSRVPQAVTAAVVVVLLILLFSHEGLAWKHFAGVAGALISAAFILGSLAPQASRLVWIGAVLYAFIQGRHLILSLHHYWAFGGSIQHLLAIIMPPILVTASVIVAIYQHVRDDVPVTA